MPDSPSVDWLLFYIFYYFKLVRNYIFKLKFKAMWIELNDVLVTVTALGDWLQKLGLFDHRSDRYDGQNQVLLLISNILVLFYKMDALYLRMIHQSTKLWTIIYCRGLLVFLISMLNVLGESSYYSTWLTILIQLFSWNIFCLFIGEEVCSLYCLPPPNANPYSFTIVLIR